jgi:hypothetical protein
MNRRGTIRWATRPSERKGFDTAYYMTDSKGDYIRVDFSRSGRRALLLVEDRTETRFTSRIENNHIREEWSSRSVKTRVSNIFRRKADLFSTVPDDAMDIIRGFYGIGSYAKKRIPGKRQYSYIWLITMGILLVTGCAVVVYLCFRYS